MKWNFLFGYFVLDVCLLSMEKLQRGDEHVIFEMKNKKTKSIKRFSWRQLASSSSCRRRLRWCRRRPECDVCRSRSHRCRRAQERRTLIVSDFASCRRIGFELKETIVEVETWIVIRKLYIWLLVKKNVWASWVELNILKDNLGEANFTFEKVGQI